MQNPMMIRSNEIVLGLVIKVWFKIQVTLMVTGCKVLRNNKTVLNGNNNCKSKQHLKLPFNTVSVLLTIKMNFRVVIYCIFAVSNKEKIKIFS